MFLDKIIAHKKQELESRKRVLPLAAVKREAHYRTLPRNFFQAISQKCGNSSRIIAEIKKASPSQGMIRGNCDPQEIGNIYQKEGAVAISVLTDSKFFRGDLNSLSLVRNCTTIPLLCKDFIIDQYQIYEAALHGADGFLLIATLLSRNQMEEFLRLGRELGMEALVEVHTHDDLGKTLLTSAQIIGINNRDLKTFNTDLNTTLKLIKSIPTGPIVVSESGIHARAHVERLEKVGVHAFLIGEALMREQDPGKKLRELRGEIEEMKGAFHGIINAG